VRGGATSARLGASVIDRYERRTKTGNKLGVIQLSDPSGQYEAIIFQEGLGQYRDLLEKGADVLVTLQANVEGEDVRARIIQVESLTEAAAKVQKGLRVFVRDEAPLASIAERLRGRGEGEVSLVVMLGPKEGEVEVKLPGRYAVTGALAGALKAVAGVVAVEQV
jgi:DNA polymerase-3 subunit alpha